MQHYRTWRNNCIELQRVVTGGEVDVVEMGDHMRHVARALVIGEIATTLEDAIDSIRGGKDGEVIVVGEGDEVDKGGEERVIGVFFSKTQYELGLKGDLQESDRNSQDISQKINTVSNSDILGETTEIRFQEESKCKKH